MTGNCTGTNGAYGESRRFSVVLPSSLWVLLNRCKTSVGVETASFYYC